MNGWVIVVVPDGPMALMVIGDADGRPYPDQHTAEAAALDYRAHGTQYSVYVSPVRHKDGS